MGNFRKIHTIPHTAFQDSKDRGASSNWKSEGVGKTYVWNSECMGGEGLDLEFPQGQTRVYSL